MTATVAERLLWWASKGCNQESVTDGVAAKWAIPSICSGKSSGWQVDISFCKNFK